MKLIKTRLKRFKMTPQAHKQKQIQHQTQGKSVLSIFFENITFRTYFVKSLTYLKFKSILTANIKLGLPVLMLVYVS